jgi:hypothetical protein
MSADRRIKRSFKRQIRKLHGFGWDIDEEKIFKSEKKFTRLSQDLQKL